MSSLRDANRTETRTERGCVRRRRNGNPQYRRCLCPPDSPQTVPAGTVDRPCGPGRQAVNFATQAVLAGGGDLARIADLPAVSAAGGCTTVATSSPISDGVAALPVADRSFAGSHGLRPRHGSGHYRRPVLVSSSSSPWSSTLTCSRSTRPSRGYCCFRQEFGIADDAPNVSGGAIAIGRLLGSAGPWNARRPAARVVRSPVRPADHLPGPGTANITIIDRP
jgi:hypothetical protein